MVSAVQRFVSGPPKKVAAVRSWARELGIWAANSIQYGYSLSAPRADGPIEVIDVFCGCGGLSSGFEFIGRSVSSFRIAGAADIDPYAISSYRANLGITPTSCDLSNKPGRTKLLESIRLRNTVRRVLVGGPPCQGFSAHQKKSRAKDDFRNKLVLAFGELVRTIAPDFVVCENVPEILAQKNWAYFEGLRSVLNKCGYEVRAQIHNLAGFGVPQERFRAIVVAAKKPFSMPEPFLEPSQYRTVRQTIGNLPEIGPGRPCKVDSMHYCTNHRKQTVQTIRAISLDGGTRPPGVGPKCLDRVDGFRDVYGRMYWDRPANTITASARNPASGRFSHPEQHRGLTIREAAMLQGFPVTFDFVGPFDDKFIQIGNAVPPIFSAYLAAHILGELLSGGTKERSDFVDDIIAPRSDSFSSGIAGMKKWQRN
jgi:DNA (cytosine-5)-methyltransferase 1